MAMIPVRTRSGVVSAVAILTLACGGDESSAPSATPAASQPQAEAAEPARPAPPPPPPTAPSNIQVDERDAEGNPVRFSGTDSRGNAFEARFGDDADVPDGFPDDVPIYPDSTPTAAMTSAGEGVMVTLKSADDQQTVFSYYESGLTDQGWTIDSRPSFGGQLGIEASKQARKVTLRISGTEGDSYISIVVREEN